MDKQHRTSDWIYLGILLALGGSIGLYAIWNRTSNTQTAPLPDPGQPGTYLTEFDFVDQQNRPISRDSLKGRVSIIGCVFTCCTMSCPKIMEAMARLQKELAHPEIRLVSISVDPEHDTPEVLAHFAGHENHQADPEKWLFLTQPDGDRESVYRFLQRSLGTLPMMDETQPAGLRVTHTNRLMLVDRTGKVTGSYLCVQPSEDVLGGFDFNEEELTKLKTDAEALANKTPYGF